MRIILGIYLVAFLFLLSWVNICYGSEDLVFPNAGPYILASCVVLSLSNVVTSGSGNPNIVLGVTGIAIGALVFSASLNAELEPWMPGIIAGFATAIIGGIATVAVVRNDKSDDVADTVTLQPNWNHSSRTAAVELRIRF